MWEHRYEGGPLCPNTFLITPNSFIITEWLSYYSYLTTCLAILDRIQLKEGCSIYVFMTTITFMGHTRRLNIIYVCKTLVYQLKLMTCVQNKVCLTYDAMTSFPVNINGKAFSFDEGQQFRRQLPKWDVMLLVSIQFCVALGKTLRETFMFVQDVETVRKRRLRIASI